MGAVKAITCSERIGKLVLRNCQAGSQCRVSSRFYVLNFSAKRPQKYRGLFNQQQWWMSHKSSPRLGRTSEHEAETLGQPSLRGQITLPCYNACQTTLASALIQWDANCISQVIKEYLWVSTIQTQLNPGVSGKITPWHLVMLCIRRR